MVNYNNIVAEIIDGENVILETLQEKIAEMRKDADLRLGAAAELLGAMVARGAAELVGSNSRFAKLTLADDLFKLINYQRGILYAIQEIERVLAEMKKEVKEWK